MVGQVYILGMTQSKSDMAKALIQIEGKSVMEGIVNNIKLTSSIEPIHSGKTSGADVVILKIPAIDDDENFIYNPPGSSTRDYDYITYYLENKNFHKAVESTNISSRLYLSNGIDDILLTNVKSLSLLYNPAMPDASKVSINLVIENTKYKKPIEVPLRGQGTIRND